MKHFFDFLVSNVAYVAPILLLFLALGFKLAVGENPGLIAFFIGLVELPCDIIFLGLSFLTSYAMIGNSEASIVSMLGGIIIAFFIFYLTKRLKEQLIKSLIKNKKYGIIVLVIFGFVITWGISLGYLQHAITLLKGVKVNAGETGYRHYIFSINY